MQDGETGKNLQEGETVRDFGKRGKRGGFFARRGNENGFLQEKEIRNDFSTMVKRGGNFARRNCVCN